MAANMPPDFLPDEDPSLTSAEIERVKILCEIIGIPFLEEDDNNLPHVKGWIYRLQTESAFSAVEREFDQLELILDDIDSCKPDPEKVEAVIRDRKWRNFLGNQHNRGVFKSHVLEIIHSEDSTFRSWVQSQISDLNRSTILQGRVLESMVEEVRRELEDGFGRTQNWFTGELEHLRDEQRAMTENLVDRGTVATLISAEIGKLKSDLDKNDTQKARLLDQTERLIRQNDQLRRQKQQLEDENLQLKHELFNHRPHSAWKLCSWIIRKIFSWREPMAWLKRGPANSSQTNKRG